MWLIKKGFTLVEMLIVIVIIWILMAALLPKLTSAQDKAKDKKTMTAVRDYLIAQEAGNSSYPIHASNFSTKAYIIDKWQNGTDISSILTKGFKKDIPDWGKGSWVFDYNIANNTVAWTPWNWFLTQILSKLSTKDMSQLTWNDNTSVVVWFIWNFGKILSKYKSDPGVSDLINTLKNKWFTYIDKTDTTNPAKAVWWWFILWLDKTPWNGWVKISDSDLIADNAELKNAYVNFAFVNEWLYFMSDLITSEEQKKALVTSMLKAIKASGVSIWNLSSGD